MCTIRDYGAISGMLCTKAIQDAIDACAANGGGQVVIPAGTYSGQDADVTTVAVKATYIVSNDMSEDLVYSLTKALFESKDAITAGHAKGAELDTTYAVEGVSVPFHPGAQKYFEEIGVL